MPRFYLEYKESQVIAARGWSFYALIMAAMRRADNDNLKKLGLVFPDVLQELQDRYKAPGGFLDDIERISYGVPPVHKE